MGTPYLVVECSDGRDIFLGRIARSQLPVLEVLLRHLQQRWIEYSAITAALLDDPACLDLLQRIANLFPRFDVPGEKGFDIRAIAEDSAQVEALFLCDRDEKGQIIGAKVVQLHHYEPVPRSKVVEEEAKDLAFDSSGDPGMDLLANLACAFEGRFDDAWSAFNTLDSEQLDRFLYTMGELRRDPEERKQENLAQDYAAWKEENEAVFQEALGIKPQHPAWAAKNNN